jgi:protein phosphatase
MHTVRFACVSHEGQTHTANEDRWLADPPHGLYLVSDGMANDIAPEVVLNRLPEFLADILVADINLGDAGLQQSLGTALEQLNQLVREVMRTCGELGLGATLVLVLVRGGQALVAHLGDSRVYLCRSGALQLVTRDHSLVQELLDRGVISAEEAAAARSNGGPTRFLGMHGVATADIQVLDLHDADRLLLCSDGLTEMLTDGDIERLMAAPSEPQAICQELVDAANAAGGLDNITALVIEIGAK